MVEVFHSDLDIIDNLIAAAEEDPGAAIQAAAKPNWMRQPPQRNLQQDEQDWLDRFKDIRDSYKKSIGELADNYAQPLQTVDLQLENLTRMNRGLSVLMRQMMARYRDLKREAGVIDFSDMEQLTSQLLDIPEVRKLVRERFDHIFVDEFQDVS